MSTSKGKGKGKGDGKGERREEGRGGERGDGVRERDLQSLFYKSDTVYNHFLQEHLTGHT